MKFEEVEHCLMTIEEAATALRLSRFTLNNWLSQGRIKRVKIGRRTFIARQEIDDLLSNALCGEISKNPVPRRTGNAGGEKIQAF